MLTAFKKDAAASASSSTLVRSTENLPLLELDRRPAKRARRGGGGGAEDEDEDEGGREGALPLSSSSWAAAGATAADVDGGNVSPPPPLPSGSPAPPSYPSSGPVRTVYLACPPDVTTGGPEAMHQLCDALNRSGSRPRRGDGTVVGVEARMLYLREAGIGGGGQFHDDEAFGVRHIDSARRPEAYASYDAPAAIRMPGEEEGWGWGEGGERYRDREEGLYQDRQEGGAVEVVARHSSDLIIWPEVWTHLVDSIPPSRRGGQHQTAIWWLSVDNNRGKYTDWDRDDVLHLYQSEYARKHLEGHGVKPDRAVKMTEYIPDRRHGQRVGNVRGGGGRGGRGRGGGDAKESSGSAEAGVDGAGGGEGDRDIDVLYNPHKGMHYTDELIRRCSGRRPGSGKAGVGSGNGDDGRSKRMTFAPIGSGLHGRHRLPPSSVSALLRRARIYVDFGPHPGMDRLPREAALAGCLVVTNREGAARYKEDVPIPEEYRVGGKFDPDGIRRLMRRCLEEYTTRVAEFDGYRGWIAGQEGEMARCVDRLLDEIVMKRWDRGGW